MNNENKKHWFALQGGLGMGMCLMLTQAMNPLSLTAGKIYGWTSEAEANQLYGLASSLVLITGLAVLLGPAYLLYIHLGRINSLRIAHLLTILGCCLMLIRHTAGLMVGRSICGLAFAVFIANSMPYAISSVPGAERYYIGSVASTISRVPALVHALLALAVDSNNPTGDSKWVVLVLFPGMLSAAALGVTFLFPFDNPDSVFRKVAADESRFREYYRDVYTEEFMGEALEELGKEVQDYSLAEFFCRPGLNWRFFNCCLMILMQHLNGSPVILIFTGFVLTRFETERVAQTFNFVMLASDIWIVLLGSVLFRWYKRVKPIWLAGLALMAAFNIGEGVAQLVDYPSAIKWLMLFERQVYIFAIDLTVFNYLPQVMSPKGFNICMCLFLSLAFLGSQTFIPMITTAWAIAFFFYAGISLVGLPIFCCIMEEAPSAAVPP
jgi:hypothetical protein